MKGLIIKDLYCLRKGLKTYILVTMGVVVTAIMFVLSSQHGNLAAITTELKIKAPQQAELLEQILEKSIWILLLVPIAFLGNLAECFKEDTRAGFRKILSGIPLGPWKIVGSRYLTCLLFGTVSMAVSSVAAFFIAAAADTYVFSGLMLLVMLFGIFFLFYMSINLFLIYVWGARRADLAQIIPLALLALAAMVYFTFYGNAVTEEEMLRFARQLGTGLEGLLERSCLPLFLLGTGCMALSYIGSVAVVKRRRGDDNGRLII